MGFSTGVIYAVEDAWRKAPKVWIPKEYWNLEFDKGHLTEREGRIAMEQLEHYIVDQGLAPTRTIRLSTVAGALDPNLLQLLIPNEMLSNDENGVLAEASKELGELEKTLDVRVTFPDALPFLPVNYNAWMEARGIKEYTETSVKERVYDLVGTAEKAAKAAEELISAEAVTNDVATTKRCAEGIGHLYREHPRWVDHEKFKSAYRAYAQTPKMKAKLRISKLATDLQEYKSRVAQAVTNAQGAANGPSGVLETEQALKESKILLQRGRDRARIFETTWKKLESIKDLVDGGDGSEYIQVLVKNPQAVWVKL